MSNGATDEGEQSGPSARRPRVLLVDDSPVVRKAMTQVLEEKGFRVDAADSGEEAFERCCDTAYSLVVTDQTMGGLSGTQLCRLLRSEPATAGMPLILLTADDDPRSRFRARDAGADAYVPKSRARTDLAPAVARLTAEQEAGAGERTTGTIPKLSRTRPLERLGEVLETVLFRAQVGSEVRSLVEHIDDRTQFGRALAALVAQVARYDHLVLRLDGPQGPTFHVDARGGWSAEPQSLRELGIEGAAEDRIELVSPVEVAGPLEVTDHAVAELVAAGEVLGELRLCASSSRLGRDDREIVGMVAEELGVVVKSLFLLEETYRLAHTDGLTKLPNRRAGVERLEHEIERSRRQGTSLCVVICDIDHFKQVNDTHGHDVGDDVLKAVAESMEEGVRKVDLVARWGGEEFVVVLPSAAQAGGRVVAERLRLRVQALGPFAEGPDSVTMSFGLALWNGEEGGSALVARADEALYRAKSRGRNRVEIA